MAGRIVHSEMPLNAEPPLPRLRGTYRTDQADFYTRSHGPVPVLEPSAYRLTVSGRVATPRTFSLDELRTRFAPKTVDAVLQCAGNRRADLHAFKPVLGDPWSGGAIGNACWTGIALADVLEAVGADEEEPCHVRFASYDTVEMEGQTFPFGVSIPMAKASSPEVLLAFEMNGEALTPEHGFPLRVVTPGFAGVRSPKWLASIDVGSEPSGVPTQSRDYKLLPPDIDTPEAIDWSRGSTIDAMPVNSAICEPAAGARIAAGPCRARGWAIASARFIARVDISSDGGRTWTQATCETQESVWSWCFWAADIELAPGTHEIVVRAFDDAGQTQPSQTGDVWNVKGYLSCAWHRVTVVAT